MNGIVILELTHGRGSCRLGWESAFVGTRGFGSVLSKDSYCPADKRTKALARKSRSAFVGTWGFGPVLSQDNVLLMDAVQC